MGKKKKTSHRERQEALNRYKTNKAVDVSYDMGHRNGFYNCLTIMMYSIMESTNYKHNGLMKIWNKTLDITEAMLMPETGLTSDDIVLALAEEANIIVDPEHLKRARRAVQNNDDKAYKQIVEEALVKYREAVEARLNSENSDNEENV